MPFGPTKPTVQDRGGTAGDFRRRGEQKANLNAPREFLRPCSDFLALFRIPGRYTARSCAVFGFFFVRPFASPAIPDFLALYGPLVLRFRIHSDHSERLSPVF